MSTVGPFRTSPCGTEDLVDRPDQFSKLMAACQLGEMPVNFASQRVDGKSSSTADRYADDEWYAAIEYEIETLLRPTLVAKRVLLI